jgi:hypothetical protein
MALLGTRSRRISDDPAGGIGTHAERGQVVVIRRRVVAALPTIAHVGRVSGEQDGCFEFAGVHVVVVVAANSGGMASVCPVIPARIQANLNCIVGVDFLRDIGKDVIAAGTIHNYQCINVLLPKGSTDVDNDSSQRGSRNAHGAREIIVFMRAPERNPGS